MQLFKTAAKSWSQKLEFEVDLPSLATVVCLDLMIPSPLTIIVANNWVQHPSSAISG